MNLIKALAVTFALISLFLFVASTSANAKLPDPATTSAAENSSEPVRATISAELNVDALQPGQQAVVAVVVDIANGYHAQSHEPLSDDFIKTEVTVPDGQSGVSTFAPIYPAAVIETFPVLGKLSIYTGRVVIYVPIQVASNAPIGDAKLSGTIRYQICNDKTCFQPESAPFELSTHIVAPGQQTAPANAADFSSFDPSVFSHLVKPVATVEKVELFGRDLDQTSRAFVFLAAFVIGIIFNVVPCVLPVLPIKAIGFYEVSQHNRAKCLLFGFVFSAGLIASFFVLGLLVVVLHKFAWGEQFSNPYFLGAIVLILLVMAFSLFGAFDVGLPVWIYKITPRHDTFSGNFLFGILTAILSTPCTIGLFVGLLVWASRQPPLLGLTLVMTVGAGMASPYLALSAAPELARKFPRSGPWASLVKQMLGFLLLASAAYFARRFISGALGDHAFWYALLAVVIVAAIFLIVRSLKLGKSMVAPSVASVLSLAFVLPSTLFIVRITHPPIDWKPYTVEALEAARKSGQPVMLEFTADWCSNCVTIEATVFHDPATVATLKTQNVIALRADLSKEDAPGWKLLREISPVGAIPLTAIYHGTVAQPIRITGIYSTGDLVGALKP